MCRKVCAAILNSVRVRVCVKAGARGASRARETFVGTKTCGVDRICVCLEQHTVLQMLECTHPALPASTEAFLYEGLCHRILGPI
eukprot:SAG31_NODE_4661_length_3058_cov_2.518756_4_plen_85_part_00